MINFHSLIADETTVPNNCTHGSLRLVNTTHDVGVSSGRLEICINQAWGTVCGGQFGFTDATVACRQLEGFYTEGKSAYDFGYVPKCQRSYMYIPKNVNKLLCKYIIMHADK